MMIRNVFLLILVSVAAAAQDQKSLTFEVASVKPSGPKSVRNFEGGPGTRDPSQITCTKANLMDLLWEAYAVKPFQVEGPAWIKSETESDSYDLHAKIPAGTTKAQAKLMMQNLLAERFKLTLHHVTKEFTAYELVIAKSGLKFKESDAGQPPPKPPDNGVGYPALPEGRPAGATNFTRGHARLAAHQQPISNLAEMMEFYAGLPIVDKTGLTGKYDYYLHFDPTPFGTEPVPDAAPGIPVALEQQLGLKLESKKLPFDVLVIDHVEKVPTEN